MRKLLSILNALLITFSVVFMFLAVMICSFYGWWDYLARLAVPAACGWFFADQNILEALQWKWKKILKYKEYD